MNNTLLEKYHFKGIRRPQNFSIGDKVCVYYKIKEGEKERIQKYEGSVIAIKNKGVGKSFTVHRISYNVGVERIFPLYAPTIDKIEVLKSSKIRRAKLYYLRNRIGKQARLKEIKKKAKIDIVYENSKKLNKE